MLTKPSAGPVLQKTPKGRYILSVSYDSEELRENVRMTLKAYKNNETHTFLEKSKEIHELYKPERLADSFDLKEVPKVPRYDPYDLSKEKIPSEVCTVTTEPLPNMNHQVIEVYEGVAVARWECVCPNPKRHHRSPLINE
jgi:hypothetical protein